MEYVKNKIYYEKEPLSVNPNGSINYGSFSLESDLMHKYKYFYGRIIEGQSFISSFTEAGIKHMFDTEIEKIRNIEISMYASDGIRVDNRKVKPLNHVLNETFNTGNIITYGNGELIDSVKLFNTGIEFRIVKTFYEKKELKNLINYVKSYCNMLRERINRKTLISKCDEANLYYIFDGKHTVYLKVKDWVITDIFYFDENGKQHVIEKPGQK